MLSPREQQQLISEALKVFGKNTGRQKFTQLGRKFGPFGELLGLVTDTLTRDRSPGPNDITHAIRLLAQAGFDVKPGGTSRIVLPPTGGTNPPPPPDWWTSPPPPIVTRGHVVTPPQQRPQPQPRTPPAQRPQPMQPQRPSQVETVGRVATVPRVGDLQTAWPAEHDINTSTRQAMVERKQDSIFRRSQFSFFPESSNVYAATYDPYEQVAYIIYRIGDPVYYTRKVSSCSGRVYSMGHKPNQQGPMYSYGSRAKPFTQSMWNQFLAAPSAGEWIWANLRVCGSQWEHQIPYTLVNPAVIGGTTAYVPRKATSRGFRSRAVAKPGTGKRGFIRSTLPEQLYR